MRNNKKSQIWVETVIYTLIGLAIIGVLLSILKPVIEEKKDQLIIGQSIDVLNAIESKIEDVRYYGVGNSRPIEISIKKGVLKINGQDDNIEFLIESRHQYSQLNQSIMTGKINATTIKKGSMYDVSLKLNYKGVLNITFDKEDQVKILQTASTPYNIFVANLGSSSNMVNIDFS